jgi:ribonuclease P protein subunit POP4
MHINPKEIIRYELIGLKVEIAESKNKSLIGIKGKIIDETKNLITIEMDNKITKKIIKDQVTLNLKLKDHTVQVKGQLLVGRPEERIKKIRKIK